MTEREKQLIEAYLPSPPDPTLEPFEYYVLDVNDKLRRGYVRDICPLSSYGSEKTVYTMFDSKSNRRICYFDKDDPFDGFEMRRMYDNKEDCRNGTHDFYNDWTYLRALQQKELRCDNERV